PSGMSRHLPAQQPRERPPIAYELVNLAPSSGPRSRCLPGVSRLPATFSPATRGRHPPSFSLRQPCPAAPCEVFCMYDPGVTLRGTGRQRELPTAPDPVGGFRLALTRARKLLGEFFPGMSCEPARLQGALALAQKTAAIEAERLLLLGWLSWLSGDNTSAEGLLAQADEMCKAGPGASASPSEELAPFDPALL